MASTEIIQSERNNNNNNNYVPPIYNIPLNDVPKSMPTVVVHLDNAHRSNGQNVETGMGGTNFGFGSGCNTANIPDINVEGCLMNQCGFLCDQCTMFTRCFGFVRYFWKYLLAIGILIGAGGFCYHKFAHIVHNTQEIAENTWTRIASNFEEQFSIGHDKEIVSVDIEENIRHPSLNAIIRYKREENLILDKQSQKHHLKCIKNHLQKMHAVIKPMAKRVKDIHKHLKINASCEEDDPSLNNSELNFLDSNELSEITSQNNGNIRKSNNSSEETSESISISEEQETISSTTDISKTNIMSTISTKDIDSNEVSQETSTTDKNIENTTPGSIKFTNDFENRIHDFSTEISIKNTQDSNEIINNVTEIPLKIVNHTEISTSKTNSTFIITPEIFSDMSEEMPTTLNVMESKSKISTEIFEFSTIENFQTTTDFQTTMSKKLKPIIQLPTESSIEVKDFITTENFINNVSVNEEINKSTNFQASTEIPTKNTSPIITELMDYSTTEKFETIDDFENTIPTNIKFTPKIELNVQTSTKIPLKRSTLQISSILPTEKINFSTHKSFETNIIPKNEELNKLSINQVSTKVPINNASSMLNEITNFSTTEKLITINDFENTMAMNEKFTSKIATNLQTSTDMPIIRSSLQTTSFLPTEKMDLFKSSNFQASTEIPTKNTSPILTKITKFSTTEKFETINDFENILPMNEQLTLKTESNLQTSTEIQITQKSLTTILPTEEKDIFTTDNFETTIPVNEKLKKTLNTESKIQITTDREINFRKNSETTSMANILEEAQLNSIEIITTTNLDFTESNKNFLQFKQNDQNDETTTDSGLETPSSILMKSEDKPQIILEMNLPENTSKSDQNTLFENEKLNNTNLQIEPQRINENSIRNANDNLGPRQFATSESVKTNQELKFNMPNSVTSGNVICFPNPQQFPGGISFPQQDQKQIFTNGISPRLVTGGSFPGSSSGYSPYLNYNYYNGFIPYPNMYPNYNIQPSGYYGTSPNSGKNSYAQNGQMNPGNYGQMPPICHYVNPPTVYPSPSFFRKTNDQSKPDPQPHGNNNFRNSLDENFGEQKTQFKESNLFLEPLQCDSDTEMSCSDGSKCIPSTQWCDSNINCADSSDELSCSCKHRVDKSRLCDGFFDCPNGEDELGCFGCPENQFSCDDWNRHQKKATCVPVEQRCDGIQQCTTNGKDETDCSMLAESVFQHQAFHVSLSQGFLHHNYRGVWYPVCNNDQQWGTEACLGEVGAHLAPPLFKKVPFNKPYKGNFIESIQPTGDINLLDICVELTYVICPRIECGTRMSIAKLRNDDENDILQQSEEGSLFRLKRFINSTTVFRRKRQENERVVGGHASEPAAWPWVIALYRDGIFHCGGVIINENWIVTAAHCVEKYWQHYYEVQAGMLRRFSFSPMEQIRSVEYVIVHHNYDRSSMKNDLSLLRLQTPLAFNRWIRDICLPSVHVAGPNWKWGPSAGTACIAVGWGATVEHGPDPDHMREVEVPILPFCKHRLDREGAEICAGVAEGGRDACQGDSGGPLLCPNPENKDQWFVAGVVSHGEGCARPDEPGAYTRVSMFIKWIQLNILETSFPQRKPLLQCPGVSCVSNGGKCLSRRRKCDGVVDCLTAEDELNCEDHKQLSTISRQTWESLLMAKYSKKSGEYLTQKSSEINNENETNFSNDITEDYVDDTFLLGQTENISIVITTEDTNIQFKNLTDFVFSDNSEPSTTILTEFKANQTSIHNQTSTSTILPDVMSTSQTAVVEEASTSTIPPEILPGEDITMPIAINPIKRSYFICKEIMQNIPVDKKCDNEMDCEDGTDEKDCTCKDLLAKSHPEAICDGNFDCIDGTDEENCYFCPNNYFFCEKSLQCVKPNLRCNGHSDCQHNEDEIDCVLLTNAKNIYIDSDGKPKIEKIGYVTTFINSKWELYCNHNLNNMNATGISIDVCNNLGHSSFYDHQIRTINYTNLDIVYPNETKIVSNPLVLPKVCKALYVRCNIGIVSKLKDFYLGRNDQNPNLFTYEENNDYSWPWNGLIYINGIPKCTGTLINVNWVLTSQLCTKNVKIDENIIVVAFGTGRGILNVQSPYEQLRRVNYITDIANISLMHLETPTNYSRFVKTLPLTNKITESLSKDICVATGIDKQLDMFKTIFLKPNLQNCTADQRCFKQIQTPKDCSKHMYSWGGTVVCYSQISGWYPSAVFYETKGLCSFAFTKPLTSIISSLNLIVNELRSKLNLISPPLCSGLCCPLGKCIETNQICDNTVNCRGGTDETVESCNLRHLTCENQTCDCTRNELKCKNGQCIPKSKFCDGIFDCADNSDETETCSCGDYLNRTSPQLVCDGIRNCLDKSDEKRCNCTSKSFKCDGGCIPNEFVCDGERDCPNGEDEKQCIALKHNKDHDPFASGEVYMRSSGLWHVKCFPNPNITQIEIENICNQIGFLNGRRTSRDLLTRNNDDLTIIDERIIQEPVFDKFQAIRLNKVKILYARLGKNIRSFVNLKYVKKKCNVVNIICE